MKSKPLALGALLLLLLLFACNKQNVSPPSEFESAKTELLNTLKSEGASFSPKLEVFEDENATVTILKSKNENDTLNATSAKLEEGVLLGVFRVKNKKNKQADTYSSTLVVKDSSASLRIVNLATKAEQKIDFPVNDFQVPPPPPPPPPPTCDFDACIDYFNANIRPALQAQANVSCKDVFYCLSCPINGQPCVHILFVIRPTRWRCFIVADVDITYYALQTLPFGVGVVPR
jgi:hypothetical protein